MWSISISSRYDDRAKSIELLASGDIVIHFTHSELRRVYSNVVKINSSGQVLWKKKFRLAASESVGDSISMSTYGNNTYVAGIVTLYGTQVISIYKLDSAGSIVSTYSFRYDNNGFLDKARIVVVSEDVLYLSCILNDAHTLVARLDNNVVAWQKVFSTNKVGRAYFSTLELDSDNNVYVDFKGQDTMGILKVSLTGELLHSKVIGRLNNQEEILDISVSEDKVFALIYSSSVGIVRYDTELVPELQGSIASLAGHGGCFAVDFDGTLYVAAWWFGLHVFKLPGNGSLPSTSEIFDNGYYEYMFLNRSMGDMTVAELPNTALLNEVLAPEILNGTQVESLVPLDSALVLGRYYKTWINAPIQGSSIFVTSSDNMYIAGEFSSKEIKLIKYGPSRTALWTRTLKQSTNTLRSECVVADSDDNAIIAGSRRITTSSLFITKLGADGVSQWSKEVQNGLTTGSSGTYNRAVVDSSGNIYAVGTFFPSSSFYHLILTKFSPTGVLLWNKCLDIDGVKYIEGNSLALDGMGNVYTVGSRASSGATFFGVNVSKITTDGTLLWSKSYLKGTRQLTGFGIAIGSQGLSVSGRASNVSDPNDGFVLNLSSNGDINWSLRVLDTQNANNIALDASQNLYTTFNNVLLKISPLGEILHNVGVPVTGPITLTSSSVFVGSGGTTYEYYLAQLGNMVPSNLVVTSDSVTIDTVTFTLVDASTLGLGATIVDTPVTNTLVSSSASKVNVIPGVSHTVTPHI